MRILFWQDPFWTPIGGVRVQAERLLGALAARGHRLLLVAQQSDPAAAAADEHEGIPMRGFSFCAALSMGDVERVSRIRSAVAALKRGFAPDIVHLNGFGPSALYHLETEAAHAAPFVMALHSSNNVYAHHTLTRRTLRLASWVTACSESMLAHARGAAPEITPRSSVVYNGASAAAEPPAALSFDPPHILCLGRLVTEKGFDLALHACARLRRRIPHLRLTLVGDGPARADLERLAAQLELGASVTFAGAVAPAAVPSWLNRATLVMLPSRRESFSLAALEAALMMRPVVATRVDGLPEVVADGHTGLLVDPDDADALAAAAGTLLTSPGLARTMGQEARRRALARFSLDRHVNAYEALYERIVADSRRRREAASKSG